MTMKSSRYLHPETRPFGAFNEDLTDAQWSARSRTINALWAAYHELYRSSEVAVILRAIVYALDDGLVSKKVDVTENPSYKWIVVTDLGNQLAAWYDLDKKVWCVLEYNKVRGITVRNYGWVPFLKKLVLNYHTTSCGQEYFAAEDIAPFITRIFPDMSEFVVEFADKPSDLYDADTMGHINSCMVGEEYVKFYDTAPVQGVIVRYRKKAVARSLIWTLADGRKVIDRIYDTSSMGTTALTEYCKANGIDTEFKDTDWVKAPVCDVGVPYLDNLDGGIVRIANDLYLFRCSDEAYNFRRKHSSVALEKVYDGYSTGGNKTALREKLIKVGDKHFPRDELVKVDGVYHVYDIIPHINNRTFNAQVDPNTLYRHPFAYGKVVKACDIVEYNGTYHHKDWFVTAYDGELIPISDCRLVITLDDTKNNIEFKFAKITDKNPNLIGTAKYGYIRERKIMVHVLTEMDNITNEHGIKVLQYVDVWSSMVFASDRDEFIDIATICGRLRG